MNPSLIKKKKHSNFSPLHEVELSLINIYHSIHIVYNAYTYANYTIQIHNRQIQIHRRLRCSVTNVLLLTSEFGSSTRGERDTILKSLLYHTMLTTPQRSPHFLVQSQFFQHHGRNSPSHHHGWTPTSTVCH